MNQPQTSRLDGVESRSPIDSHYMLVTNIPYYLDPSGAVWVERLWHRDLVRHWTYLTRFVLAAPAYRVEGARGQDLIELKFDPLGFRVVALPKQDSALVALANMPRTALALYRAAAHVQIVHSGVVGWPYPLGWLASAFALLRKRTLVIVVESAPYRLSDGDSRSWKKRARARVMEAMARYFVNRADLSFFTTPSYRQELLTRGKGPGYVVPASWIDDADVLTPDVARAVWQARREAGRTRLLFVGRLSREKGVQTLLEAIELLRGRHLEADVDILGEGAYRESCLKLANLGGEPKIRMLAPVSYGPSFFALLRGYHAIVVPSLSDEQPRIVFDAFSQAMPVIAADTNGLRPNVAHGKTGWLFTRGDASALADRIAGVIASTAEVQLFGLAACDHVRTLTHGAMHAERWRRLNEHLRHL